MFLSNTNSFRLTLQPVVKPVEASSYVFSPNTDSFLLIQQPIVKPSFSAFSPNTNSFLLTRQKIVEHGFIPEGGSVAGTISQSTNQGQSKVTDRNKRNFLKVAGVAGAGLIASQLAPKKAQALIMGSSPTTGVVGVKDSTNTRINPATEETVDSLLKPSDLTFDAGDLQVKVTGLPGSSFSDVGDVTKSGLVDGDRHVQVDVLSSELPSSASTETTLQTISFGGFKFTLYFETVGNIDYLGEASIGSATSSAAWRVRKLDNSSGLVMEWAGTGVFDQIWDNRASLSYS